MDFFPHQENSNSKTKSKFLILPKLIREACAQCSHGSCIRSSTPSTLSSLGSTSSTLGDTNLDLKQLIILEIQSRIMKAKSSRPTELLLPFSGGMLTWAVSPTTGRVHITPLRKSAATGRGEEECDDGDGGGDGDETTEEFFSVKSYFSCYSIDGSSSSVEFKDRGVGGGGILGRSVLEEFRHCEGWPFGLCRRAVVLPPLPSSPSDSWVWRKRNLVCKTNFPKFRTNLDRINLGE